MFILGTWNLQSLRISGWKLDDEPFSLCFTAVSLRKSAGFHLTSLRKKNSSLGRLDAAKAFHKLLPPGRRWSIHVGVIIAIAISDLVGEKIHWSSLTLECGNSNKNSRNQSPTRHRAMFDLQNWVTCVKFHHQNYCYCSSLPVSELPILRNGSLL